MPLWSSNNELNSDFAPHHPLEGVKLGGRVVIQNTETKRRAKMYQLSFLTSGLFVELCNISPPDLIWDILIVLNVLDPQVWAVKQLE